MIFAKSRSFEGVPGSPGKSQKEGQEDQGEVKELGGMPSWLPPGILKALAPKAQTPRVVWGRAPPPSKVQ